MTKEELKTVLEEYIFDKQYLNEKIKELQNAQLQKEKLYKTSTHFNDQNSNESLSYILNEKKEEARLKKIIDKKQRIEDAIQYLPQPHKTIMYFKYICFLTFDQIADKMNYSTKRIYQLHKEGLIKLLKYINDNKISMKD